LNYRFNYWLIVLPTGWHTLLLSYILIDRFVYLFTGWQILSLYLIYWLIYFASVSFLMADIFCFSVLHTGWHILLFCLTYWLTNLVLFFIGWHFASLSYIFVDIVCFSVLYRPLKQNRQLCLSAAGLLLLLLLLLLLCQFVSKRITVCFKFEPFWWQPCWFALYQRRTGKGWLVTYLILFF